MDVRNDYKYRNIELLTEKQWKKKWKIPKKNVKGIQLYTNGFRQETRIYYTPEEVQDMAQKQILELKADKKYKRIYQDKIKKLEHELESSVYFHDRDNDYYEEKLNMMGRMLREIGGKCDSIPCENQSGIICVDVETTGLETTDEIIQISIIDGDENVLLNSYVKPYWRIKWSDATAVNGIDYEMVKDSPYIHELVPIIKGIFDSANKVVLYNASFDLGYLKQCGIDTRGKTVNDVMIDFAAIYGEWNDYYEDYKWQKLTTCAEYYGYKFKPHDSLEDVKATLFCYYKMLERQEI